MVCLLIPSRPPPQIDDEQLQSTDRSVHHPLTRRSATVEEYIDVKNRPKVPAAVGDTSTMGRSKPFYELKEGQHPATIVLTQSSTMNKWHHRIIRTRSKTPEPAIPEENEMEVEEGELVASEEGGVETTPPATNNNETSSVSSIDHNAVQMNDVVLLASLQCNEKDSKDEEEGLSIPSLNHEEAVNATPAPVDDETLETLPFEAAAHDASNIEGPPDDDEEDEDIPSILNNNEDNKEDNNNVEEDNSEEPDQDDANDDAGETSRDQSAASKKRKIKKRIVGSPSESIKQMKDAVVRTQAIIAATKVSTIQAMTTYAREKQNNNNPRSHTVLLSYDEIVERPDKMGDGERQRDIPMWTLLLPNDLSRKQFGAELEKLGKALQEDIKPTRQKKGGGKYKKSKVGAEKPAFNITVAESPEEYLASIYGPDVKSAVAKKMKSGNNI
jgi:hypothetical protein